MHITEYEKETGFMRTMSHKPPISIRGELTISEASIFVAWVAILYPCTMQPVMAASGEIVWKNRSLES